MNKIYDTATSSSIARWSFGGLGNWRRAGYTPVGGNATTEVRQHNAANQVTKFGTTDVRHDASPYGRALSALDPAAYWRLGEASGASTAADQTGNNDGTYSGSGVTLGQTGALTDDYNTAVTFDGTNGDVDAGNPTDLQITGAITLTAWVKLAAFPGSGYGAIVSKGYDGSTNTAYWLAIKEDSGDHYLIAGAGESAAPDIVSWRIDKTNVWPTGQWVQVATVFDGANWRLFCNGQQVDEAADDTSPVNTGKKLYIAAFDNNGSAAHRLAGTLDEVAVFGSALTLEQINELYRIGRAELAGPAGNGNIVNDGTRRFVYDAFNRVKEVYKESGGVFSTQIAAYTYDALGRRIRKVVPEISGGVGGLNGDTPAGTTDYLYNGVQCVEERDGSNTPLRQYVWGRYVDELIEQKIVGGTAYYPLSDLLYRSAAIAYAYGVIHETHDCDAYGNTIVYNSAGTGGWWSDDETATNNPICQFIFTGRRFDPETSDSDSQVYFYRARYYSPVLGRFISRDPIGYEGGMNLYEYVGGMAVGAVDATGTLLSPSLPTTGQWETTNILGDDMKERGSFHETGEYMREHEGAHHAMRQLAGEHDVPRYDFLNDMDTVVSPTAWLKGQPDKKTLSSRWYISPYENMPCVCGMRGEVKAIGTRTDVDWDRTPPLPPPASGTITLRTEVLADLGTAYLGPLKRIRGYQVRRTESQFGTVANVPMAFTTWAICPSPHPDVPIIQESWLVTGSYAVTRIHTGPELHVQERSIIPNTTMRLAPLTPPSDPGTEGFVFAADEARRAMDR